MNRGPEREGPCADDDIILALTAVSREHPSTNFFSGPTDLPAASERLTFHLFSHCRNDNTARFSIPVSSRSHKGHSPGLGTR